MLGETNGSLERMSSSQRLAGINQRSVVYVDISPLIDQLIASLLLISQSTKRSTSQSTK